LMTIELLLHFGSYRITGLLDFFHRPVL
jgi:hypothetical protein